MKNEYVLSFSSSIIDEIGSFQGLNFNYAPYIDTIFSHESTKYRLRSEIETDFALKQVIPYVIMAHEGNILFYVRGKRSGEKRLISKGSIGIGGHISIEDDQMNALFAADRSFDAYSNAVNREVREELHVNSEFDDCIVAVLNDDTNDVGRVHFGVVHLWELKSDAVKKREQQITEMGFYDPETLVRKIGQLENWSALCVENIAQIFAAAKQRS